MLYIDYKRIIKSRKIRLMILSWLSFVPDKLMLKIQYKIKMGKKLNLNDPKSFTEKMQWYKLYYKDPAMIQCVDKYDVRSYIKRKGYGEYLNKCYGVYTQPNDIDFSKLPNKFVLKDTLGGGGNDIIICLDKTKFNIEESKKIMNRWIASKKCRNAGREWPYYKGKNHRIIIEEYLEDHFSNSGLIDYKFFCFNGKVEFMYVMSDRSLGNKVSVGLFDREYNRLPYNREGDPPLVRNIPKPENYEEMINLAENLSKDFPHARIDLYNINKKIIFGEITFYNASGYMKYEPDDFDLYIGNKFNLKEWKENKIIDN
ncbi:ATP-grasp fold amidoligase family protein [Fusobacterium hominis]|jgi:hypothetical protein|uniref:ATP-grasp fold amidoligase family protein n=1 Tax=Fusobacterium hominis TaxID=2764326 RepID=UPI0022E8F6D4|nr:ATP-grasp fold amidoligase family protein [Fusobacterium hominis]